MLTLLARLIELKALATLVAIPFPGTIGVVWGLAAMVAAAEVHSTKVAFEPATACFSVVVGGGTTTAEVSNGTVGEGRGSSSTAPSFGTRVAPPMCALTKNDDAGFP